MIYFTVHDEESRMHEFGLSHGTNLQRDIYAWAGRVIPVNNFKLFWNDGSDWISLRTDSDIDAAVAYTLSVSKDACPTMSLKWVPIEKKVQAKAPLEDTKVAEQNKLIAAELQQRAQVVEVAEEQLLAREKALVAKEKEVKKELDERFEFLNEEAARVGRDECANLAKEDELLERESKVTEKEKKIEKQLHSVKDREIFCGHEEMSLIKLEKRLIAMRRAIRDTEEDLADKKATLERKEQKLAERKADLNRRTDEMKIMVDQAIREAFENHARTVKQVVDANNNEVKELETEEKANDYWSQFNERDIAVVMKEADVTRAEATKALINAEGDIVTAIMALEDEKTLKAKSSRFDEKAIAIVMAEGSVSRDAAVRALEKADGDIDIATIAIENEQKRLDTIKEKPIEVVMSYTNATRAEAMSALMNNNGAISSAVVAIDNERSIDLVMSQANVSRALAIHLLKKANGDIVNAISGLF